MKKNKENIWKTLAIIFIVLFLVENLIFAIGAISIARETKKITRCYYDICNSYPDAEYIEGVCFCYDYGVLGELVIVKEEYMG